MVSIFSFLPEYKADEAEARTAPHLAIGAASPLWLMFGGAAAAGATYWWWASRWREAVNLEALMALTPEPVAPPVEAVAELEATPPLIEALVEPAVGAVALAVQTTETVLDAAQEIVEAAAEPLVETAAASEDVAEAVVEPIVEAEPVVAEAAEAVAEAPVEIAEPIAAAVEAAPEAILAAVEAGGDDLTRLVGVGPKLAASLAELGVTTFSQIAAWTPDELASYDQLLNLKGRAERDAWIAQAKRFAAPDQA
jgi:predicted flap endonuclease-1-like 5' DNA nuclease